MANQEFWVRLRPRNPRKGIKLGRFMAFGMRFDEERGWYRVKESIIRFNEDNKKDEQINFVEYLRTVRNDNEDPDSPLAFDVCTQAEALKLMEDEKKAKEKKKADADAPNPVDLVTIERKREAPGVTAAAPVVVVAAPAKRKPGRPPKAKPEAATE